MEIMWILIQLKISCNNHIVTRQHRQHGNRPVTSVSLHRIGSVLKHFPGYGNNVDTHTGIALDGRPAEQFWREDFLPFQAGIEAGAPAVLVSHNVVSCFDSDPLFFPRPVQRTAHR